MADRSILGRLALGCALIALAGGATPAAALRITEFMASNAMTITDEDGEFSDWIELHNESGAAVDLGGHYLTDDAAALTKWQLPSGAVIPAAGLVRFLLSDHTRR